MKCSLALVISLNAVLCSVAPAQNVQINWATLAEADNPPLNLDNILFAPDGVFAAFDTAYPTGFPQPVIVPSDATLSAFTHSTTFQADDLAALLNVTPSVLEQTDVIAFDINGTFPSFESSTWTFSQGGNSEVFETDLMSSKGATTVSIYASFFDFAPQSNNVVAYTLFHLQTVDAHASDFSALIEALGPENSTPDVDAVGILSTFFDVAIDIKPGDDANSFNNDSQGVLPVAIFGSENFDVTEIDLSSVRLDSLAIKSAGKSNKLLAHLEDINEDSFSDYLIQIDDTDVVFDAGDYVATLTGTLLNGQSFVGTDSIAVVPNPLNNALVPEPNNLALLAFAATVSLAGSRYSQRQIETCTHFV